MRYVALLRGINVGGNSKVDMKELAEIFEKLGFTQVKTYINSGNVLFESPEKKELAEIIEKEITKKLNLSIHVVVKTKAQITSIANRVPPQWKNDTEMKTDVLFLWDEVNSKDTLSKLIIKPEIDNVVYVDGAVVWNVARKNVTKSGLLKIVGTELYKKVTVRNVNTLRKLNLLLESS